MRRTRRPPSDVPRSADSLWLWGPAGPSTLLPLYCLSCALDWTAILPGLVVTVNGQSRTIRDGELRPLHPPACPACGSSVLFRAHRLERGR